MKNIQSIRRPRKSWLRKLRLTQWKNYRTYTQVLMPVAWLLNFSRHIRRWYMAFSYRRFGHPSNFHWTYYSGGGPDSASPLTFRQKVKYNVDMPNLEPGERSLISGGYYDANIEEETA